MTDEAIETVRIAAEEEGQRLDRVLAARIPALSRSRLKALILDGQVTIQGRSRRARSAIRLHTSIPATSSPSRCRRPSRRSRRAKPIPLTIVYEDDALIVIDKPKGLVVHPAAGHAKGTLVNALIAHCGDSLSGIGGVKRPGIVHRLDKDTTGLMVVAKTDAAHRALSAQFANKAEGGIERGYLALVWGAPEPAEGHHRRPARPPSACPRQARRARRRPPSGDPLAGAGALSGARRQAGRQPLGLHPRDRPHPPDPGASRPYRPSDPGRRHLRYRFQDQGQPAFPGSPRRPRRSWQTGPACLSTRHRTPH